MKLWKYRNTIFWSVFIFIALGVLYLAYTTKIENRYNLGKLKICDEDLSLSIRIVEQRNSNSEVGKHKLLKPACDVVRAAKMDKANDTGWLKTVQFWMIPDILTGGKIQIGQARHNFDLPSYIEVTPSALERPPGILAFTLSHELGHGQLMHSEKIFALKFIILIVSVIPSIVWILKYNSPKNSNSTAKPSIFRLVTLPISLIIFFGGIFATKMAHPLLSVAHEFEADKFALENLRRIGYSLPDAQRLAVCNFADHLDDQEENGFMTENPHPSTSRRLELLGVTNLIHKARDKAYCAEEALPPIH